MPSAAKASDPRSEFVDLGREVDRDPSESPDVAMSELRDLVAGQIVRNFTQTGRSLAEAAVHLRKIELLPDDLFYRWFGRWAHGGTLGHYP